MVTVRLKGVHVVRVRLADGARAEYHYAWKGKGAPRLEGRPGSPEYVTAFEVAHRGRKQPKTGTFYQIITAFRASPEYAKLGDHTTRAYGKHLDAIEGRFGELPIPALEDPKVRRHFIAWRNTMSATPRTADYAVGTLKRLLTWAVDNAELDVNHAEKIKRLHTVDRSDSIWTADDLLAFDVVASKELRWAVRLAAYTGFRQSDLISLTWTNYDGASFMRRTSKRGKVAIVPAVEGCRTLMGEIEKRQATILTTERGKRPWTADGLRSSFAKACKEAGVKRSFHDLRRTAATNLLAAGMEAPKVALIMGWEEAAVDDLKRKYVSRTAVVQALLAQLEKGG